MSSEASVKGYAPLPQSISNTDTEDDDDEHDHQADSTSKEDDQSRISDTTVICQNGRFYPLDETKNLANRTRNGRSSFGYSNDNIPIMLLNGQNHDDLWKRNDMSPLRKFFLVVSVLLCVVTILVFLYVLPCDTSSLCPPPLIPKTAVSWDKSLDGVEIHGKISVIPGKPYSLIFLIRGQQFGKVVTNIVGDQQITPEGGGILSVHGSNGIPLWWVVLNRLPVNINCELFDTDRSGKPDCLISGEDGLLVSIEPSAGTIHWTSDVYTHSDLPLLLSDLDSDGINDLLSIEVFNNSQNLVFISGKNGKLLTRYAIPGCQMVQLIDIDSSFVLSYLCYNENYDQLLSTLFLKNFLESYNISPARHKLSLTKLPPRLPPRSDYPNQSAVDTWDLTSHHRLYVRNVGGDACPAVNCLASVNLTLRRGMDESRIWDEVSSSSFVTRPAILDGSGQNFTTGFVLKFWNWTNDLRLNTSNYEGVQPRNLTERVSMVFVNNTNVHVMNTSLTEVLQLCQGQNCQPSLSRQASSMLIADLNGDGVTELISYRSSYLVAENESKPVLSSKIQVIKLDGIF